MAWRTFIFVSQVRDVRAGLARHQAPDRINTHSNTPLCWAVLVAEQIQGEVQEATKWNWLLHGWMVNVRILQEANGRKIRETKAPASEIPLDGRDLKTRSLRLVQESVNWLFSASLSSWVRLCL